MEFPYDQFFAVHMYKMTVRETIQYIWKLKMDLSNKTDFHPLFNKGPV